MPPGAPTFGHSRLNFRKSFSFLSVLALGHFLSFIRARSWLRMNALLRVFVSSWQRKVLILKQQPRQEARPPEVDFRSPDDRSDVLRFQEKVGMSYPVVAIQVIRGVHV